jgi:hypothetical protein
MLRWSEQNPEIQRKLVMAFCRKKNSRLNSKLRKLAVTRRMKTVIRFTKLRSRNRNRNDSENW